MNAAKYREVFEENQLQSARNLRELTFQDKNDPKRTAKITLGWLRDKPLTLLERPRLKSHKTSVGRPEGGSSEDSHTI